MSDSNEMKTPKKLLRLNDVIERTGLSRSTVYNLMDEKHRQYDPTFPRQVALTQRSVAWFQHELDSWIDARTAKSRAA